MLCGVVSTVMLGQLRPHSHNIPREPFKSLKKSMTFHLMDCFKVKGGSALSPFFLAPFRSQNMKVTVQQFLLDVLLVE